MTEKKRFKLHIEWYNKEKTDGEKILYDKGQPLGVIESMEDARLIRNILNELYDENEELKQSVNNLKDTIIKITIAYQRKYDRTIVDLVDEVHDEDITDLIKELKE